jgi:NAD(P)-dependent dehydrogenase (short-subunit alcohol dehydrogenase family)
MVPSAELTDRAALTARTVPVMTLSDGSATSMTPPPDVPIATDAAQGAKDRFTVKGNAIVAGGAGTLGIRACDALLEHGLSGLMIIDLNPAGAKKEIAAMQAKFPDARVRALDRPVDVTDEEAVEAAVEDAIRELGPITTLISFVGVVGCVPTIEMPVSQWRKILDINTTSAFILARAVAKRMIQHKTGGSITFISSISAHRVNYPQPQAGYNVSKAALITLKNSIAAEWAHYGIRTNTISPGYMDTILNEGDGIMKHRQIWAERNPSGRMGSPSELTGTVVLLASDAGTYINGTDIVVDGGQILF